jgi:hypothetical protein
MIKMQGNVYFVFKALHKVSDKTFDLLLLSFVFEFLINKNFKCQIFRDLRADRANSALLAGVNY